MSMDIFSLHEGLGGIHLCRPARGKHYVDNYLRATYMPEEDIMVWVRENYRSYAYRHMHGLLSQTMNSVLNTRKLKDAVAVIDSLYEVDKSDTSKSMLSMEASFTNMISSRLRR